MSYPENGTTPIAEKVFNQMGVEIWQNIDYQGTKTICVTLQQVGGSYEDAFRVDNPKEVAKELREIADFLETI